MSTRSAHVPDPGFPGAYWRAVGWLALVLAAAGVLAAGLAYLISGPALARDYFSAHRAVRASRELLLPGIAAAAGAGFLLAAAGGALLLRRHTRRLRRPALELEAVLRDLAAGRLPQPGPSATGSAAQAAATLAPLRAHMQEIGRLAKEIQTLTLHLHYRSAGDEQLTLKDLRGIAVRLDGLVKDLVSTASRFEG